VLKAFKKRKGVLGAIEKGCRFAAPNKKGEVVLKNMGKSKYKKGVKGVEEARKSFGGNKERVYICLPN
jgi:hypothetical protein